MINKRCPAETELVHFVDGELPPERLERIAEHIEVCGVCSPQVAILRSLIADIKAPLERRDTATEHVASHVASVMARLDEPARGQPERRVAWGWVTMATAAAAALLLWVRVSPPSAVRSERLGSGRDPAAMEAASITDEGEFFPRGKAGDASLARDVGVQLYTFRQPLAPLQPGGKLSRHTALTAGLRNLARTTAHLLLFAVDSKHVVHWIAPAFTNADSDPAAYVVPPSSKEQPLASSVTFEDLALGPMRVVAVITPAPLRVSDIEGLTPRELSGDLALRFPGSVVRQVAVEVVP